MARTVTEAKLDNPTQRKRLDIGKPAWRTLIPAKLHLGYRRKKADQAGEWVARRYVGGERYRLTVLGLADDYQAADEITLLSFMEAQRRAQAVWVDAQLPTEEKKRSAFTVKDAIDHYVEYLKLEKKTGRDAELRANALILPFLQNVKVADLTTKQIKDWRNKIAAQDARLRTKEGEDQQFRDDTDVDPQVVKQRRQSTANRTMTILKGALNRAVKDQLVEANPAWKSVERFTGTEKAREDFLTLQDAQKLIAAADAPSGYRDLLRGALETGCRYGELRAMKVRELQQGKIHIPKSKSGKERWVRLTDDGRAFVAGLCAEREPNDPIFRRADGTAWLLKVRWTLMRDTCIAAGLKPVGFHQLRHTWASLAVMNGMPLAVVARNLGHANTKMVEKHYGHYSDDYLDAAIQASAPKFSVTPEEPSNVVAMRGQG